MHVVSPQPATCAVAPDAWAAAMAASSAGAGIATLVAVVDAGRRNSARSPDSLTAEYAGFMSAASATWTGPGLLRVYAPG